MVASPGTNTKGIKVFKASSALSADTIYAPLSSSVPLTQVRMKPRYLVTEFWQDRLVNVQSLEPGGNCARNLGDRMPMRDLLVES